MGELLTFASWTAERLAVHELVSYFERLHEMVKIPCGHCGDIILSDCADTSPDAFGHWLPSCVQCASLYQAELDHEHDRDDAPSCNHTHCARLSERVAHVRLVGMYSPVHRYAEQSWINEDGGL